MMEWIREWLLQVMGAAALTAAVTVLTPRGAVRRITLLCCAVLLLLSILRPLQQDLPPLPEWSEFEWDIRQQTEEFQEKNQQQWEALIEGELVSYIEAKAAELQCSCEVSVRVETGDDGIPLPQQVDLTAEEKNELLHCYIRDELGFAEEQIRWRIA